jgi:tetratricopeptide (TPR) repeat protein
MNTRTTLALLLVVLVLAACAASLERLLMQGNRAFARGDYAEALQAYQAAQELAPDAAEPIYNSANTFYRQELYTETQQLLPQAVTRATGDLLEHSYYNLGNAYFQTQKWEAAIAAYQDALRLNPHDHDAKYNLELALQQQQNERQQQNDQNESEDEQDKQEQEPQNQEQEPQDQPGQDEQEEQNETEPDAGQADTTPPDAEEPEPSQSPAQQPAQPSAGLTEAQARQLLDIVGENADTLQERMQQIFIMPGPPPAKDW